MKLGWRYLLCSSLLACAPLVRSGSEVRSVPSASCQRLGHAAPQERTVEVLLLTSEGDTASWGSLVAKLIAGCQETSGSGSVNISEGLGARIPYQGVRSVEWYGRLMTGPLEIRVITSRDAGFTVILDSFGSDTVPGRWKAWRLGDDEPQKWLPAKGIPRGAYERY